MKPRERLALEILEAMRRGERFTVAALLQGMLAFRREQKAIVDLLGRNPKEGVALAVLISLSPWFFKEEGGGDRKRLLAPVYEALRGVPLEKEERESVVRFFQEATWPEIRFLRQLTKRLGVEVEVRDLVYAMSWLTRHRTALTRLGVGQFVGVERAEAKEAS